MAPTNSVDDRVRQAITQNAGDLLDFLSRRTQDVEDAADLYGDLCVLAWRRRRIVPVDPIDARKWLFVAARNLLLNHHRARQRRNALTAALATEMIRQSATVPGDASDERLAVESALAELPSDLSELVRLIHWDRMSIAEAAAILDIPASTARSRYAVARAALADRLDPMVRGTISRRAPRTGG